MADQLPVLVSDHSIFCNRHESIRVALVRKHFGLRLSSDTRVKYQLNDLNRSHLQEITQLFTTWRDTTEIMPIKYTYEDYDYIDLNNLPVCPDKWINSYNAKTGKIAVRYNEASNVVCFETESIRRGLKICPKRGNSVYVKMINEKFQDIINSENHKSFFSTVLNKNRNRVRKTNLLYVTGTTAPKYEDRPKSNYYKILSMSKAWLSFGSWWNSFITNLRQQFGKLDYIRAWQSQENGYPHFHALIYFHSFKFTATYWKKDNSWRIHNRQMLNHKPCRDRIKSAWVWGNLDVKCCDDSKKAVTDITKYITRNLEGGESDLTNAMVWYFGKQSYAVTDGFKEVFAPNIDWREPSNDDLINAEGVIQSNDSKKRLKRIEVFPVIKHAKLLETYKNTLFYWQDLRDPPPPVIEFLEKHEESCVPVIFKKKLLEDGSMIDIVVYKYKES